MRPGGKEYGRHVLLSPLPPLYAPYGSIRSTAALLEPSNGSMRSNWRLTRGALRRRKWLFMPLVRMIFPVPVILNRFLAPLWVFILVFFGLAGALICSDSFLV